MASDISTSNVKDESMSSSESPSDAHIRIENLRKTFNEGDIVACDDINLEINSKDFVVLLGPSGCGKTTTLRCLSGLDIPDSGHIYIGDEEVTRKKPKDRDLAFVFQSIALFPHMTVGRNISFGLDMVTDLNKEEKQRRVEEVAELLGISGMLDRKPAALSGGQQQRVSLGRAMVMEPEAFLLDEPFSALDANLRDQMRVEVKQLQRELETAMVFVTHDQEEAMTLGDKIVIMDDARIQQVGSPYDIYNEPENLFVAQFIGSPSTNIVDCEVKTVDRTVKLQSDFFTLSLSNEQATKLSGHDGQRVKLGIRPEYLELGGADGLFKAEISVIEPHGARDAVHLFIDDVELTAMTPQGQVANRQGQITVELNRDKIWVFNDSGERLL